MRARASITALGLALLAAGAAPSSAYADESELWLAAEGRWEIVDGLNLSFGPELRFNEGMTRLDEVLPEVALSWRVLDWLKVGSGYRFEANRRKNGDFRFGHRLHLESTLSRSFGPVELSYRLRYEHTVARKDEDVLLSDEIRQRVGVELEVHEIVRPFVETEFYAELKRQPVAFTQANFTAGVGFKFDDHRVEAFYRNRQPINSPADPVVHVLGVGYRYSF